MNPSAPIALEVRDLLCSRGAVSVHTAQLSFHGGTFTALRGAPESGHELLLRILGLLESPDAGQVFVAGETLEGLSEDARLKLRDRRLGYVFAAPFLLTAFTVIENVAMPFFKVSEADPAEARLRGETLLDFVGLLHREQTPCTDLTPLEQHCVSLARALVNEPAALLIESLDTNLHGDELNAFTALLRQAAARFQIAVVATVSPDFRPEPGDHVIEFTAAARPELLPKPQA